MTTYRHIIFLIVIVVAFLSLNIDSVAPCLPSRIDGDENLLSSAYRAVESEGRDEINGLWKEIVHKESGIVLRLVPAGEFDMGSNSGEADEKPVHRVQISEPFYIGKYEVTQKQWKAVMGNNPGRWKGDNLPVERVSWKNAQEFCRKVGGDLPTEAQWEYACRAGTNTKWSFGDATTKIGEYAWYRGNHQGKLHEVGQKSPNPWGLHDMHGNAWEWCRDWYESNYYSRCAGGVTDPTGPGKGTSRVIRGGSIGSAAIHLRSARRHKNSPDLKDDDLVSFRVVIPAEAVH